MSSGLLLLLVACSPEQVNGPVIAPPGAAGPITVRIDDDGIAHIEAESDVDAFWAQGYFTARDRMWHMDLMRRRARGTQSAILGEAYLSDDTLMRGLRWGALGDATAEQVPIDDPEIAAVFDAYAAGVNQFMADAAAGRHGLSFGPQIEALDYTLDPWTTADSYAIEKLVTGALSMRPSQDLVLGLVNSTFGPSLFSDLYRFAGMDDTSIVPDYYDTRPPPQPAAHAGAGAERVMALMSSVPPEQLPDIAQRMSAMDLRNGGSNNFAIAGAQSASGHALVASDTHLDTEHPSAYYYVHLSTADAGGDMNAVGATFPGVPLVLFGHNDRAAWVPTTGFQDAADTYLEAILPGETNADGVKAADRVSFNGELIDVIERDEVFEIREPGSDEVTTQTIRMGEVPHHGPLLPNEALGLPLELSISIRWTGALPRTASRAFFEMAKATDWESFRDAESKYFTGGMHWLYGDDTGMIGYTGYTAIPVREQLDTTTPPVVLMPGDGDYEWVADDDGEYPFEIVAFEDVPWVASPSAGYLVTANNDPSGTMVDNNPLNDHVYLSGLYDLGGRAYQATRRIDTLLAERKATLDDVKDIQLDTLSRPAERMLPYLHEAAVRRPDLVSAEQWAALDLLAAWDYRCDSDDAAATLFHGFMLVFVRDLLSDHESGLLGEMLFTELDSSAGGVFVETAVHMLDVTADDIDALDAGTASFPSATGYDFFDDEGTPQRETRDELLLTSLDKALDELAVMMDGLGSDPDDPATWTWDIAHSIQLDDPGEVALQGSSSERLSLPGGLYTFNIADFPWFHEGALPERFDAINISSNRFVFELVPGAIRGEAILPGGQSDHAGSAHHNDQLLEYTRGEYRPLAFYRSDIEAQLEQTWELEAGYGAGGELTVTVE